MKAGKIAIYLFALTLIAMTIPFVYGESIPMEINARCNSEEKTVAVEITIDSSYNKSLGVYIVKDELTPQDISKGNVKNQVIGVAELQGVEGIYTAVFNISETAESGWYKVVVGDYLYNDITEQGGVGYSSRNFRFYYANSETVKQAVSNINNADKNNINQILEGSYGEALGLSLSRDYEQLKDMIGTYLIILRKQVYNDNFASVVQIQTAFDNAVALAKIYLAEKLELDTLFLRYASQLDLNITSDYTMCTDEMNRVFTKIRSNADVNKNPMTELQMNFRQAIAIAMLNTSSRQEIETILKNYNDVLKLDLTGDYLKVDSVEVDKVLSRKGFESIVAIQNAFNSRIRELLGRTSTSSGGGGGSSKVHITQPTDAVLPPNTHEQQQEKLFTDLDSTEWAREAVEYLARKDVLNGTMQGIFEPNGNVTREQFVKMIVLAFEVYDKSATVEFSDVNQNEWYYHFIASAVQSGLVQGYEDGSFGVGENIKRQDMAIISYRAVRITGRKLNEVNDAQSFADFDSIADYSMESVTAMQKAGIINGFENNTFAPNDFATRAQAAKIIYGLIKGVL